MPRRVTDHIYSLLSDAALNDEQHLQKLEEALENLAIRRCIHTFPIIPALFLELTRIPKIHRYASKKFLWEYWSKTLVEDSSETPDTTEINRIIHIQQFGCRNPLPLLPYKSLAQLEAGWTKPKDIR